jgi:putative ABC transport system permease protein
MKLRISDIILRAVAWHRGSYITLALVTALIASVITASLLAGYSVRETLSHNAAVRLNGGGVMVSSGLRFSDRDVAAGLALKTGVAVAPLMELHGRVSTFGGGAEVKGVNVWGVDSSFFIVGGATSSEAAAEAPQRGEVILNSRLAETLKVAEGESVIVRFAAPSDLPRNTPFSPGKEESEGSLFLTVKKIVISEPYGLFNPSISQVVPHNVFVNGDEFNQFLEGRKKSNRFLFKYSEGLAIQSVEEALSAVSVPGGQSLRIRSVPATGETEIVSDRIFIDEIIADAIVSTVPGAQAVITWLANTISSATGATPYSFVAALSGDAAAMIQAPYDIVINEWLAADLAVGTGDSVTLSYYLSGSDSRLTIDSARFRVTAVVPLTGIWRDSLLMPAFPGITGSRSCTDWDTGIPLNMKLIRDKDEEYWYNYAGTPKAFISYETGTALWGNQFGPATSIRWSTSSQQPATSSQQPFPHTANLTPLIGTYGFVVTDLHADGLKAAVSGVDFSTLFLALSFFLIASALILLVMIMDNHLRSREGELSAYIALGFRKKKIRQIFITEATIPVTVGAIAGAATGILFNYLIIDALNSVWIGAVQTDTLRAYTGIMPLVSGAFATLEVAVITLTVQIMIYLRKASASVRDRSFPDGKLAGKMLPLLALITMVPFILLAVTPLNNTVLHFLGGSLLFALSLLLIRRMLTPDRRPGFPANKKRLLSLRYYAYWPSRAVTPVLFIASGLFIVIATGANRQDFGRDMLERSSGTGGFTHWIETTMPVEAGLLPEGNNTLTGCMRIDGDDASCLNLNFITSPHLLGVDAMLMAERGSFAFASGLKGVTDNGFWELLPVPAGDDAIYGFLDQTVMQWGMKVKPGDTVTLRSESGQPLHVIIAGGFKTSLFQGHLVVDKSHFRKWFPSVAGSNVILTEMPGYLPGTDRESDMIPQLEPYGARMETTSSRLESFNRVTNTYLSVFVVLGGLGMILGVTGMGLIMIRNIRSRRKEFALLTATGFSSEQIRKMLLTENLSILFAGVITGSVPAIIATWPSFMAGNGLQWSFIAGLLSVMIVTGSVATILSAKALNREKVPEGLRKEK